jgi:gamma-glutamyltranspeptidase / glutathione hydrolase
MTRRKNKIFNALRFIGAFLLFFILIGVIGYALLPKGPRDLMDFDDPYQQERPMVEANEYAVVAGTPWATDAALDVLARGGNAYDATVAALLMLHVTHGEAVGFPSIAPLVTYDPATGSVQSYVGVGVAPQAATLDYFQNEGFETMPDFDIRSQLVPASPDVMIALLKERGTMSFSELAQPAIDLAREGYPMHGVMAANLDFSLIERIGFSVIMPTTADVWTRGEWWRPAHHADRQTFPDLANTFEGMARAEQSALHEGLTREEALDAVRDFFYTGPLAEEIVTFHEDNGGLITREDLADYEGGWEEPVQGQVGEYTIYTNGTWTQGIVNILALQTLDGIDLAAMGHNSPEYIHTVIQAIELAQADRDAYIADPAFVEVPLDALTSPEYASARRGMLTDNAFPELPPAGEIGDSTGERPTPRAAIAEVWRHDALEPFMLGKDTSQIAVIDGQGNVVIMTPSDFPKSPMIPGTGMLLGDRMTQFRLDADDVDVIAPGKRPRVTPHAVIIFRDGEFWMGYSTEGGDMQPQALIQVFLNMTVFGMDVQEAINAPRFRTISAPSSFAPHEAFPHTIQLEHDLYVTPELADALVRRGYTVEEAERYDLGFGKVGAIVREGGALLAGSDPRGETTAAGK